VEIEVRRAEASDVPALLTLIEALADYERLAPPGEAERARLVRDGWPVEGSPRFQAWIALAMHGGAQRPIAYAITFETYSSFLARPTLYIEDIFVLQSERRGGVGGVLFNRLVEEARRRGCGRVEWVVLDWNTSAQEFYRKKGAAHLAEWQHYRLPVAQPDE
jgi:GNAT superfamily N-acetyltransferase